MVISIPVISFQSGSAQTQPPSDPLLDSIINQKQQEQQVLNPFPPADGPSPTSDTTAPASSGDPLLDDIINQNNKDQEAKQQSLSFPMFDNASRASKWLA